MAFGRGFIGFLCLVFVSLAMAEETDLCSTDPVDVVWVRFRDGDHVFRFRINDHTKALFPDERYKRIWSIYSDPRAEFPRERRMGVDNDFDYDRVTLSLMAMRSPLVAMLGDSLSGSFELEARGNELSTMMAIAGEVAMYRGSQRLSMFLDSRDRHQIPAEDFQFPTLTARLACHLPLRGKDFGSPGAPVRDAGTTTMGAVMRKVVGRLVDQVDALLKEPVFPQLTLIWMGNNDTDWIFELDDNTNVPRGVDRTTILEAFAVDTQVEYEKQLRRMVGKAKEQSAVDGAKRAIVVFGLVEFESFFEARESIRSQKSTGEYPAFELSEEGFVSMATEDGREGMIELGIIINTKLQDLVDVVVKELGDGSLVSVRYSGVLSDRQGDEGPFGDPDYLSKSDAWHPSRAGKIHISDLIYNSLSESATADSEPSVLNHLGWVD